MFCTILVTAECDHFGIPNCKKNEMASCNKHSGIKFDHFQSMVLEILSFSCSCYFSNNPKPPSWIVYLHFFEKIQFKDHSDQI